MPADTIGLPDAVPGMTRKGPGPIDPPLNGHGPTAEDPAAAKRREARDRKKAEADKVKKHKEVLATALKRFKRAVESESDNRGKALEDLKFKAGDQWPGDIKAQRSNDKRPCLTVNTIPTLTHQITNDIRQNRPSIVVSPVGNRSDKESAELYGGMIRAIERNCAADIAYDTGITSAADIGFGYWRVLTEYESEESFDQIITIARVRNSFTVHLDPMRQEPDGSDANWGFVSEMLTRDDFLDQYPDANPMSWDERGVGDNLKEWVTKDMVRIAEYFCVERTPTRLVQLSNNHIGLYDELDEDVKKQISDGNLVIVNERQADKQQIMWYKLSGVEVLEEREWPGRWIPIIEVVGEEIDIEGKVVRCGAIRNAKDAQRMKNYWLSYKTEVVALAPKAPYIGAEGQFEGYSDAWRNAARQSVPYLEYVPVSLEGTLVPPPQKQPPTPVPAGVVEAEQSAERDMMTTTGIRFNASPLLERLPDESGLAIREVRRNNDIGSAHYMDHAQYSLRHTGRILIDLIPKIYDTKRVITIVREDGSEQRVTLNPGQAQALQKNMQEREEAARVMFNPTVGQYGVTVTMGPSYATKRIEAQEQLMQFARALPQQGALIAHLIAKYSDWPGSEEMYKVLVRALPPNLLMPEMKDLPPQAQQLIQNLMQQLSQLMVQRGQMLRDLTDNRADQATKRLKVERDFEAKVLSTLANMRTKLMTFKPQDLNTAMELSDQFPPGFPPGIPDPMQGEQPPGVPGMAQAPGPVPGVNMQGQLPPGIQGLPVSPVPPRG